MGGGIENGVKDERERERESNCMYTCMVEGGGISRRVARREGGGWLALG